MVADLVPEVAEQGAVRLAHGGAAALALEIVGLDERDGDQTLVMPGHHLGSIVFGGLGQELEDQAMLRILGPCDQGQRSWSRV